MSRYPQFDRSKLHLWPLAERRNDLTLDACLDLDSPVPAFDHAEFPQLIAAIVEARRAGRPVIWMIGAHRFVIC
jgi:hypothetical protein